MAANYWPYIAGAVTAGAALFCLLRARRPLYIAAIETGGTTTKVSVALSTPTNIVAEATFKTTQPEDTLAAIAKWYHAHRLQQWEISKVGVASFGPVDLDEASKTYGYITSTPKPGWKDTPLLASLGSLMAFRGKAGFNTDVNAAALAEFVYGKHRCRHSLVYVTVGTGIGVGVISDGKVMRGLVHPEGGHIMISRHPQDSSESVCPFHSFCLEGASTNIALASRLQVAVDDLQSASDDSEVWDIEAYYLAQLCLNITLLLSPEVIVLGGGVMNRGKLLPLVRSHFRTLLNHYVTHPFLQTDDYICLPTLSSPGTVGAAILALQS